MQKYRQNPVIVEAVKLTKENAEEVAQWCGGRIVEEQNPADHEDVYVGINFPTYDGNRRVSEGQYLGRSSSGTFIAYNAGFFESMFTAEEVTNPPWLPHAGTPGARQI